MKLGLGAFLALGLAVAGCAGTKAAPKEKAPPPPPTEAEQAAEMAAWMKYMTPGEEHQRMAAEAGEWTAAGKMWMYPGADPVENTGEATISMLFGGRYQRMDFRGDFMGSPFEGIGTVAFDNASREYISTWIDSMSTGLSVMRGKALDKNRLELRGTMVDPMGGTTPVREMFVRTNDTMVMEMFCSGEKYGGEFKMMELTFTRKK